MTGVKQMALVPSEDPAPESTGLALVIERLSANPSVDVDKLERIILLQERINAHQAKTAFDAAFAAMQAELPVIAERGKTDKARYATLEDIVEVVRPILARHRFALSHRTEWPDAAHVKIVGILAHEAGHEKTSEFLSVADSSGSKNAIQALGSAMAYGRRYTTHDLLNIVSRYQDDDGQKSTPKAAADVPDGFDSWVLDMELCAREQGIGPLAEAWAKSRKDYKNFVAAHRKQWWEDTKKGAVRG